MYLLIIAIWTISILNCFADFFSADYKLACYESVISNNTPELYRKRGDILLTNDEKNVVTTRYSKEDIYLYGRPICLTFYAHNKTHSVTWQGVVSAKQLPVECYVRKNEFCFRTINQLNFSSITGGISCCCSTDKCNFGSSSFYLELRIIPNPRVVDEICREISPYLRFVGLISIFTLIAVCWSIAEYYIIQMKQRLNMERHERNVEKQKLLLKKKQEMEHKEHQARSDQTSSMTVSSETATKEQSNAATNDTNFNSTVQSGKTHKPVDVMMKSKRNSVMVDVNLKTMVKAVFMKTKKKGERCEKSRDIENSTDKKDETTNVKTVEKTEKHVKKSVRKKKIRSMNCDDSTFSDLEN